MKEVLDELEKRTNKTCLTKPLITRNQCKTLELVNLRDERSRNPWLRAGSKG